MINLNPFKKSPKSEKSGINIEMILGLCETMGFDPYSYIEKKIPELRNAALTMEHQAGGRILATLSLSDDSSHFIFCLYKMQPGGNTELIKSFPLSNIKGLIEQIKTAATAQNDEPDFSPITQLPNPGGNGSLSNATDQLPPYQRTASEAGGKFGSYIDAEYINGELQHSQPAEQYSN